MKNLILSFIGYDSWSRPVYECNEQLYVDVDPRKNRKPEICTKQSNAFDGEPSSPISPDITVEFIPNRVTW